MSGFGIKQFVCTLCTVAVYPLFLCYKLIGIWFDKNQLFASYSQLFSLIPGKTGSYLRNSFYFLSMNDCSYGVVFSFGSLFSQIDTDIAEGVYIGPQCNIGSCHIGQNCLIGSGVHILSGKQQHAISSLDIPIKEQGGRLTKIAIGADCWIGNGAIIMADVGAHSVVAAGAVVVAPVPAKAIVAGNPATIIKHR